MQVIPVSRKDFLELWIKFHHPKGFIVVAYVEYGNDNFYRAMEEFIEPSEISNADAYICICDFKNDKDAAFDFINITLDETVVGCYATLWEDGVVVHENT